jgi:hypothetical protein
MKMTNTPRLGMFSVEGNLAIAALIEAHKALKSDWPTIHKALEALAKSDYNKFGEALDTDVREAVYVACNCTGDFYI